MLYAPEQEESKMNNTKEKVSYCIGLETGKNLKLQFMDMDIPLLLNGLQDGLNEYTPKLSTEEVGSILNALRNQIESQQKEYISQVAEHNKTSGESFLAENRTKADVHTTTSGLQYRILKKGIGATPKLLDVVTVHYQGSFLDGRIFDSSYQREQPSKLPVNRVIPGWSEALQLMQVGDKLQLFIPSYLAYGEMGYGNDIGPNCVLLFEMELIGIEGKE